MINNIFFQISDFNFVSAMNSSLFLDISVPEIIGGALIGDVILIDHNKNMIVHSNISLTCFFSHLLGSYFNIKNSNPYKIEDLDQAYALTITVEKGMISIRDRDTGNCVHYSLQNFHQICFNRLHILKNFFFKIYENASQHKNVDKIHEFFTIPEGLNINQII